MSVAAPVSEYDWETVTESDDSDPDLTNERRTPLSQVPMADTDLWLERHKYVQSAAPYSIIALILYVISTIYDYDYFIVTKSIMSS